MPDESKKGAFKDSLLTKAEKESFDHARKRIGQLKETRKNHYGIDLDALWAEADKAYIPHRLKTKGKKAVVTDEDKGWRGALVRLGSSDWQSDVSQSNPFIKIQTALAILIDQNPSGVFTPMAKKFQATTVLMEQLYKRSWEFARSKMQLKLFVFNLAKYGWATGRTYPLRLTRTVKVLTSLDPDDPSKNEYEEKEVVEYNDVMRENLDPRNTWIDDMAKPNNEYSINDWCWRKVYTMEAAEKEFGNRKLWKYVQEGGTTTDVIEANPTSGIEFKHDNLVEAYFYESLDKDLLYGEIGGVPVVIEPLPVANVHGSKKLSLWQTFWNLRHSESPYGVGIFEAMRFDQSLLDRIRNMTIDQLTMSIYKMFFYQGTQSLTDTGDIKIAPGVGKQVLDPKNINWLDVPGPGAQAWQGIETFRKDVDEVSGIGDPLLGAVTGKTAFEVAQAKESALKRLKDPLNNILEALNTEGYITLSLMQLMYSIPETHVISDPELIEAYLKEVGSDDELFERDEEDNFVAKIFPEFPLNLDEDEQENLIETEETQFFRIKPRFLKWEGIINIKSQSLLTPSKQVDKAMDLEMYNIIIPLLPQPPQIYGKIAKSIVKLYEKDPKEVLPDFWLEEGAEQQLQQPDLFQQNAPQDASQNVPQNVPGREAPPPTAQNPGGGVLSRLGRAVSQANPFRSQR